MKAPNGWRIRVAGVALILATLVAVVAATRAAAPVKQANPHGKFQGACGDCHGATAWKPAKISPRFDHAKFGFPLEGAHAAAACASCHATLDFSQERQLCASCHEDVHHGEFGSECSTCHTSRSFIDRAGMLRTHQISRFPLSGAHAALECESCHRPVQSGQPRFVGTPSECESCHMTDYQNAKSPDHVAANFPHDCMACHTTLTWRSARFDHAFTGFPLTGAHRTLACTQCHSGGTYQGLSPACASCHQGNYDATTNPSHAAAGFSTQCESCHTTTSWAGAIFDHDGQFFPIYSGTHAGKWANCATCHTSAASFAQFTCFSCHPHDDKAGTDSHHTQVGGYSYDSQACYSCHPRGRN